MSSDRDFLAYGSHLLPLAAMWGASYLFIEIAIEELEPATLVEIRLLLASALLAGVLVARMGISETYRGLKRIWRSALILGLLNAAVPFTLISWGQTRVDSGVAAITVATVPIFVVLLAARFQRTERVRGARLAGILLGLAGVGVLAGVNPVGGLPAVVGIVATTTASSSMPEERSTHRSGSTRCRPSSLRSPPPSGVRSYFSRGRRWKLHRARRAGR